MFKNVKALERSFQRKRLDAGGEEESDRNFSKSLVVASGWRNRHSAMRSPD
jgi:hypothetical protein